jgi:membrane associated rhomboid family serine protease
VSEPTPAQPASGGQGAPTCYRHPDRETWIRCTRCERPICPDCMTEASVGFQCPECVRAGHQGTRTARTTFGGRVSSDQGYVSKALIGISVVVYVVQFALGAEFSARFWLVGAQFFPGLGEGVAAGEFYRLLTAAFLHGGIFHLGLNMYALYLFGPPLEQALGRLRFVALYGLSALGGSAASYAFSAPTQPSLGASGAVFGLLGAFLVVSRRLGRDASMVYVLLAINLVAGFLLPNIDWRAHVGGLVAGAAVAAALAYAPRARRTPVQLGGCVAVLVVAVLIVAARTLQLTG